jgi:hypothetical protein
MIETRQVTASPASSIWRTAGFPKVPDRRRNLILPELDLDLDAVLVELQASFICTEAHASYSDLNKHQDRGGRQYEMVL